MSVLILLNILWSLAKHIMILFDNLVRFVDCDMQAMVLFERFK